MRMIRNDSIIKGNYNNREVTIDGRRLDPWESQKLRNHSPDGFNWGNYGGSGPSQLSLAILVEIAGDDALKHYQDFKWDIISHLPPEDFEMNGSKVVEWWENRK